ncbi:hypothetical protein [Allochromatium warmingii]|nr:hypothetical protein [Allochromatium warmingii]
MMRQDPFEVERVSASVSAALLQRHTRRDCPALAKSRNMMRDYRGPQQQLCVSAVRFVFHDLEGPNHHAELG